MKQNLFAKKSLGQNFLKSKKAIYQMIDAVSLEPGDLVVEVGPGKGALTGPMLERGATVYAFELDQRMIDYLSEKFADACADGSLVLIHADILEIDLKDYFSTNQLYKVVANIPYYITNAIIRVFLESDVPPSEMSLLMQKEVAERIIARDGKQSLLSLSIAVFGKARYVAKVSKNYFSPKPRVDSAIVHIFEISKTLTEKQEKLFFELIHAGFAHKRKRLFKNLQKVFDRVQVENAFAQLNLDLGARAEDLSLAQWKDFVQIFSS